jgi:hypothetical protein
MLIISAKLLPRQKKHIAASDVANKNVPRPAVRPKFQKLYCPESTAPIAEGNNN